MMPPAVENKMRGITAMDALNQAHAVIAGRRLHTASLWHLAVALLFLLLPPWSIAIATPISGPPATATAHGAAREPDQAPAAKQQVVMPLFPVKIGFNFPDARSSFDQTMKLILEQYYTDSVDTETLYWAAIKGMLVHLSSPQMRDQQKLFRPVEGEQIRRTFQGKRASVGFDGNFNSNDGSLTITSIMTGSAADGVLKPFDRVLRIGNQILVGKNAAEIGALLSGEPGSIITLKIVRDIEVRDITLTLKEFTVDPFTLTVLPGDVGLIEIPLFTERLSARIGEELQALQAKGCTRFIFDLRGATGGVFKEGLDLADHFLPANQLIALLRTRAAGVQRIVTADKGAIEGTLAIIVNRNTASASEVFAAAMQHHKRAQLFGTRTFGKAVVDRTFELPNKFQVLLTTGVLYGPGGTSWNETGIRPDVEVPQSSAEYASVRKLPHAERASSDTPLRLALEYVRAKAQ